MPSHSVVSIQGWSLRCCVKCVSLQCRAWNSASSVGCIHSKNASHLLVCADKMGIGVTHDEGGLAMHGRAFCY